MNTTRSASLPLARRGRRRGLFLLAAAALLAPSEAGAQRLQLAAAADVATGLDGSSFRDGIGIRRSRTTLRIGVDAHVDELPETGIAASLLLEAEPRTAVGADVRYLRMFGGRLALDLGLSALLAPRTLFGAVAGASYRIPLSPRVSFTVGPAVTGYFAGADLPEYTVIWQVLVRGGLRVSL